MHEYDREKDRLIIKLEAAEKAYMSLLYDYTELKAKKEKVESALREVKDLLDYLIDHNYASKNSEKEKGWAYTIQEGINRTPRSSSYWEADLVYRGRTDITLTPTTEPVKCRSVKLSSTDDTNDVTAEWNDENYGWKNEEVRRESKQSRWMRGCKRTWSCCSTEWG